MFFLQFLFLGFSIHLGKQGVQHGNELVVALVRLAAEVDEGDTHHGVFFAGIQLVVDFIDNMWF